MIFNLFSVALLVVLISMTSAFMPHKHLQHRVSNQLKIPSTILQMSDSTAESTIPEPGPLVIGVSGLISNVVCDYSLFVLKSTGSGLPAGPYGLEGALEGVSYLVVTGIVGWAVVTKVKTGTGLKGGKGLLGAAEGLSFLTVLGGIIVAALNFQQYGAITQFIE
mmetsp:Transcript_32338/g.30851  ORF Transcript_32338/g.30851 Transcript_32338/m.30851 type:complete len:164 (+) Transcript_32338:47-538(+)